MCLESRNFGTAVAIQFNQASNTQYKMFFLVLATILALVSLPTPFASQGANTTFPINFPIRIINTAHQASCHPDEEQEMAQDETAQDIRNSIRNTVIPTLCGQTQASPVASCSALPTFCSSRYHWVRSSNGTAVQVYCDLDRVCGCSSTGRWTRVANLNMSDPSQQCPDQWVLQTYSSEPRRLYVCMELTAVVQAVSQLGTAPMASTTARCVGE